MTYNVFGGMLNLNQSIITWNMAVTSACVCLCVIFISAEYMYIQNLAQFTQYSSLRTAHNSDEVRRSFLTCRT